LRQSGSHGMKLQKLNAQQELFCQQFLIHRQIEKAVLLAGYTQNKKSAGVIGSRLMKDPLIQSRINALLAKIAAKNELSAEKVLTRLDDIGGVDIAECFDEKGQFKPIHDIPKHIRQCIAQIDVFEEWDGVGRDREKIGEIRRIKFHDKIKANELLGKNLKLFNEVKEHKHSHTLENLVAGSSGESIDVTPQQIEGDVNDASSEAD